MSRSKSGVADLVQSIKQHKKFRQLASYSVQCLAKVITPPHQGWEANAKEAFDAGALEAITEVLTRHSGDSAVLSASTTCLTSMASNPKYAGTLVESGAMASMLTSVAKNPEGSEGVMETLHLLETVATHNPQALLDGGCAEILATLMKSTERPQIVAACARALESMNRLPGGSQKLAAAGALDALLATITRRDNSGDADAPGAGAGAGGAVDDDDEPKVHIDPLYLEPCFRTLDRMCRIKEVADDIRGRNGLALLSKAVALHKGNEKVGMTGSRLLTKLASGNVATLVERLRDATDKEEKEFLAQLLANLAMEEDNADKIVECGGIGALIAALGSDDPQTVGNSARALARLAHKPSNVDTMVQNGAVKSLVTAWQAAPDNLTLAASITPSLLRFATSAANVETIASEGGLAAIMSALVAHPEDADLAKEALRFLENLGLVEDFDLTRLITDGAMPAIVAAMRAHPSNDDIQVYGLRCFIYMVNSVDHAKMALGNDALDVCVACLARCESASPTVMKACIYLTTSFSLLPEGRTALGASGGTSVLLNAVAHVSRSKDAMLRSHAMECVASVLTEESVQASLKDIGAALKVLNSTKSEAAARKLIDAIRAVGAASIVIDNAEIMVQTGGIEQVVAALKAIATSHNLPLQEELLKACCATLFDVSDAISSNDELRKQMSKSGAVSAAIATIKAHPKLEEAVTAAVSFLESYAQIEECAQIIMDEGGIEACACALRANISNPNVVISATNTMLQLASSDEGAVAVARKGGTRQVINTVEANSGTPGFDQAMSRMFALLQRVALTGDGSEILIKQGGVDAIIDATDALSSLDSTVSLASTRALAKLVTRDDVLAAADTLKEASITAASGVLAGTSVSPDVIADIKSAVSRSGHFAQVGNNATVIVDAGGLTALSRIAASVAAAEDPAVTEKLLPVVLRAVASFADHSAALTLEHGFMELATKGIAEDVGVQEALAVLRNMALSSEANAIGMAQTPATLDAIAKLLRENGTRSDIVKSCFETLTALASTPTSAAVVATSTAAAMLTTWVDDNMYDGPAEVLQVALTAMANLSMSSDFVSSLIDTGSLELVKAVLTTFAAESDPNPKLLGSAALLLNRMAQASPETLANMMEAGLFRRLVKAVNSHDSVLSDPQAMEALFTLVTLASDDPLLLEDLQTLGIEDIIVAGMNANRTSPSTLKAGADAMAALGLGAEACKSALTAVQSLATSLETADLITEDMVTDLGVAVSRLANLVQIEGSVTPENASEILSTFSNAMMLLAESELAPPDVLATGVACIGALGGRTDLDVEIGDAVEMVMDVVSLNPEEVSVVAAVIHCVGTLAGNPAAVSELASSGCIDLVMDTAKNPAMQTEALQSTVAAALASITKATNDNAATIASTDGGIDAVSSVIEANAADESALVACVESINESAGGDEVLWRVLSDAPDARVEVAREVVRVLRSSAVTTAATPGTHLTGLLRAVDTALQTATATTADHRAKTAGIRLAEDVVALLENVDVDADAAVTAVETGGVDSLMKLLAAHPDDLDVARSVVKVLARISSQAESAPTILSSQAYMNAISTVLKTCGDQEDITAACLELMGAVALSPTVVEDNISRDGLRAVTLARDTYGGNATIVSHAGSIITKLESKFSDEPARLLEEKMAQTAAVLDGVGSVKVLRTEDGTQYYFNEATQETSWDKPAEFLALEQSMADMADLAAKQSDDNIVAMDDAQLGAVVTIMETHADNNDLSQAAANTLNVLSANPDNCDAIARVGGIRAIMAAIRLNPDNVALLKVLLVLLEKISRNDFYKEEISREGGVAIVIEIGLGRHLAQEEVASKCLSTLANLAYNSEANIARIMSLNGVGSCEAAMQAYPGNRRLLENAMCTLSNLMYGSDENKLSIGQTCGDEIVGIIREHHADKNLFKMALRAVGNLSYCDENIRFIVDQGATSAIVEGMEANPDDDEALQLSLEVLGNFASLMDDEDESAEPVPSVIYREGGTQAIISTMKRLDFNSAILKSGLDALSNIATDVETTELMATHQGIVSLLLNIMQSHDWDEQLMEHAAPLISALSFGAECTEMILKQDGIQVLLSLMDTHSSNTELISNCQAALANLAVSPEGRAVIRNIDGASTILHQLETQAHQKPFIEECLSTLTRLCSDEALSAQIADKGMHLIMSVIKRYENDPDFLTAAFRLVGHMAFVEVNLRTIVQHNGIQAIVSAIGRHPQSQPLMIRSIQTIDNIAMANQENAAIVIQEGGRQLIEEIMSAYADDEEIKRYGKSALLSMSALENLSKSAEIAKAATARSAPVVEEKVEDPLASFRHMLSAGQVLQMWSKGSCKPVHILVSPDWRSIVWQEAKSKKKLGACDLRSLHTCRAGIGPGHKARMLSRKKADPDCSFSVLGDGAEIALEATVKGDAKTWVNALTKLLAVFRATPHLL